jgi:hypothetical protein
MPRCGRRKQMGGAIGRHAFRGLGRLLALAPYLVVSAMLWGQDGRIVIQTVDGRNGKPIANAHLLIFSGETPDEVRLEKNSLNAVADANGRATVTFGVHAKWIQIFVDDKVLCQAEPNGRSFSVEEIMSAGLKTPNTCGSLDKQAAAGHFVIFARPAKFLEKMRR